MLVYNYLLFDAARAEMNLYKAQELNSNGQSLYKGRAEEDLAGVAPYLFTAKENTPFTEWYLKEGWNQSWGTLLFANAAFEDVYKHFRKFLMVKTEDNKELYFRFYDPRVLRIFLPTCDKEQLKQIFGPVRHFITESENEGEAIQFWLENGELKVKTLVMEDVEEAKETVSDQVVETQTEPVKSPVTEQGQEKKKRKFYLDE